MAASSPPLSPTQSPCRTALILPQLLPQIPPQEGSGRRLPLGLQIVGRSFDEAGILQLGYVLEQTMALDAAAKPAVLA